ncbi:STAS domain-containing protein [Mesoaciditoga lauensis]|uniref:STAS domain-containing protein n=1 Tax=Mesoaciditoga lauensis TaxID=1495039 RepID=UPI00055E3470|nr:STAS domain-containing protein [Mesoaciditoga lauensis]
MEFKSEGKYLVVSPEGDFDVETSRSLKEEVRKRILSGTSNIIIDLTNVSYVDSSGLGTLIALQKDARLNGGSVSIVGASSQIKRVMKMTNLDKLFAFYDKLEEVIK